MHRKQQISQTVYQYLFPQPRPNDPTSFSAHLSRNLVPEVRIEVQTFYGTLESNEARYPGLNYTCGPHRKRLGRFPHHAKLFRAFDELGLTKTEIIALCRWEGTLWARERYERDEGIKVQDTTGDEIPPWVDQRRKAPKPVIAANRAIDREVTDRELARVQQEQHVVDMMDEDDDDDAGDSEDDELPSSDLGMTDQDPVSAMEAPHMDPAWEQYWKEQMEQGGVGDQRPSLSANDTMLAVSMLEANGVLTDSLSPTSSLVPHSTAAPPA